MSHTIVFMKTISAKYTFGIVLLFLFSGNFKAICHEIPLPFIEAKFISFSARIDKGELVLNWKVSPEGVDKVFEIQKSLDGKLFEKIGYLKGNDTSKMQTDYSFVDKDVPPFQTIYYRIKLLDHDTIVNYSRVIAISGKELGILTVFPNASDGIFSLLVEKDKSFEVKIIDGKGQEVPISTENKSGEITVYPKNLMPAGFYQLKLISEEGILLQIMKVVLD